MTVADDQQEPVTGVVQPLTAAEALEVWWRGQTESELAMLLPKVGEYSAYDLELIGSTTADLIGWKGERTSAVHCEIAIAYYLLGKVGRIMGAFREGRLPSDDSWLDAGVYSRMALRSRQAGGWPGHG